MINYPCGWFDVEQLPGGKVVNVLSLFDGMSCGMLALDRLGIKVDKYYASEIDKYAMQVSAANYPEIIQVGDVCDLPSQKIFYFNIDLIW